MEAETFLAGGYGIRLAMESRKVGKAYIGALTDVWLPSRLKGIQVGPEYGVPFLTATQVYDLQPVPRKFLSLEKTEDANSRFANNGMILVTRSGTVGRTILAYAPHEKKIISDDLLRVEPVSPQYWGWIYAYLRSAQARAMMNASQYGHVIKHLETSHLNALPIPVLRPELLEKFNQGANTLLEMRNCAHNLRQEAEYLYSEAIGEIPIAENSNIGFTVATSDIFARRRRLEASFHNPIAISIIKKFESLKLPVEPLCAVTERVWWMTRFKRVFGEEGVPYMSADELFSLNAPITKRVLIEQASNAKDYFVKAGWIVMACSGQVYGINGSVALMNKVHEQFFFTHDLVRIIPNKEKIRPGYLFTALVHPQLGRPLVIRHAYGTSIPHLEPEDIETIPIVRLSGSIESEIADKAEKASALLSEADRLENELANNAEEVLDRFIAGNTDDVAIWP